MPPVTILSPYSGRPVVVREQDLGRAIRDEEGRVFYVVEDQEHGRYAARTRKGSEKDLQRYRDLQSKVTQVDGDAAAQREAQYAPHDATGKKRRNPVTILIILFLVTDLIVFGYIFTQHPEWLGLGGDAEPAAPADEPNPDGEAAPQSAIDTPMRVVPVAHENNTQPDASTTTSEPTDRADTDPRPVIVRARRYTTPATCTGLVKAGPETDYSEFHHTASGLRYQITHPTDGPSARAGTFVEVRYTAQTLDGESLIDDAEQSFVLNAGTAIRAFDEGLAGIREGEQVRLLVPRGHSADGELPGIERIPDEPFLLDVFVVSVRPGVSYVIEEQGNLNGEPIGPGDLVEFDYTLRIEGQQEIIDSTFRNGRPMVLSLGQGMLIPGFEVGVTGMRIGETRTLTIPPYLAYGENGAGDMVPPDAVLTFRITARRRVDPDEAEKNQ